MSDPESSGAVTPAAETASTPSATPATQPDQHSGTFGNNRGSGLARGKRPVNPAPQAAAAPAADYKPTAVSIVTAPTEYKNPFAPPAPPAPEAPAAPAPEVVPTPAPVAPEAPASEAPAADPAADLEPKAELNILPPETPKRVEHNWESQSFRSVESQARESQGRGDFGGGERRPRREDRRGDRPVFRPERERRGDRPADFRADEAEAPRPAGGDFSRREETPPPRAEAPKKGGGLFGWVKKLFGGSAPQAEATGSSESRGEREFGRDGGQRRRRHRGGRGRRFQGDQRGPREGGPREGSSGQFSGEPRGQGGEGGDFRHHGGRRRRRRHRGGGGYRGEGGGGYRGDSRPEGGPPPAGS